jgi:hypothetical protein
MKLSLPSKKLIVSAFSVLMVIAILLTVVPAVSAEGEGPLSPIPGLGRLPNVTLVRMHKQEASWFNDQEALFKKANLLASKYAALITEVTKSGANPAILQEGLDTFNAEIAASREIHATAGAAIFSLPAFKVNGDVRDRIAAGQSLLDGRDALKDAHFRLIKAMVDLRKNFAKWRHDRVGDPHRVYPYE